MIIKYGSVLLGYWDICPGVLQFYLFNMLDPVFDCYVFYCIGFLYMIDSNSVRLQ